MFYMQRQLSLLNSYFLSNYVIIEFIVVIGQLHYLLRYETNKYDEIYNYKLKKH